MLKMFEQMMSKYIFIKIPQESVFRPLLHEREQHMPQTVSLGILLLCQCLLLVYYVSQCFSLTLVIDECISCTNWKLSVIDILYWIVPILKVETLHWYKTSGQAWEWLELMMIRLEYHYLWRVLHSMSHDLHSYHKFYLLCGTCLECFFKKLKQGQSRQKIFTHHLSEHL